MFEELSAVSARVDDVRAVIARARDRLGGNDVRTILFIDEIHRFNKSQQDSVLHAVEDGLVTLIGATTENPYFDVNSALLSRCTVIDLTSLSEEEQNTQIQAIGTASQTAGPGCRASAWAGRQPAAEDCGASRTSSVPATTTNAASTSTPRCGVSCGSTNAAASVTTPRIPDHAITAE